MGTENMAFAVPLASFSVASFSGGTNFGPEAQKHQGIVYDTSKPVSVSLGSYAMNAATEVGGTPNFGKATSTRTLS